MLFRSAAVSLPETERGRANNFDALRFFLAALVILEHSYTIAGSNSEDPLHAITHSYGLGAEAVACFFLLSGYLITQSWLRSRSIRDYLQRRVLRIYPGFIVVSLLCGLVVEPLGASSHAAYWNDFSWRTFIMHMLTLQTVWTPPLFTRFGPFNVNGSLWTIRFEFLCYLSVIGLGLTGFYRKRSDYLMVCLIYTGFLTVMASYFALHPALVLARPLIVSGIQCIYCFLLGGCFLLFRDKIRFTQGGMILSVVLIFALLRGAVSYAYLHIPFLAYLLFAFAFSPTIRLHRFARYGDFSYGMYLYAFPIQLMLAGYFPRERSVGVLFVSSMVLTFVVAVASWYGIEKPFLSGKRKAKQTTAPVTAPLTVCGEPPA